ncbi:MAG: phosphatase PAP2 family protein [Xenococcaceae cyanobacterium]
MKFSSKNRSFAAIGASNRTRLTISLVALIGFIWLAVLVEEWKPFYFDSSILEWLRQFVSPENNPLLIFICRAFYFIGDEYFAATVVFVSIVILYWRKYYPEANVLGFSALGILILIDRILKPLIARRRPDEKLVDVTGRSFPSGHAAGNFILYFYLAYLLAEQFPHLTKYIYGATTIFLILMGFSVVYLRVHWPTDIIGSYLVGYIWLTISLTLLKFARKKQNSAKRLGR